MGWIGVITNAGAAMIAQLAGGEHTLTVTKATIGTGTVAEANLRTQTAVSGEVGEISVVKKDEIPGGVKIRLRVLPAQDSGYTAHQIGVWGKIDNGTAALIMLHQDSGTGIAIPSTAESPEFVFDYIAALAVSNTENLTVTVDPDIYATEAEVEALEEALDGKLDTDQGSGNAGKFMQVGNDGKLVPATVSFDVSGKLDSSAAAPAYDATATYAVGARCTYNGKLYRCTTAISTPEAFNNLHWTADDPLVEQIAGKADKDQGSGNAGKFMKVGADGELAPESLPDGSTSAKGIVQLEDSHTSTSTTKAATPKNVKEAYDLANGKAAPSNAQNVTAASGNWSSATPPTQTISATGVTASNNIIVGLASNATAEQIEAAGNAMLMCTAQGTNSITITAYGDKPTVNIPISVVILG